MSRQLYIQDTHCSGINSINRIGDYYSDWMNKLKEVVSIYKKEKCDCLIDGGDLLESENVSNNIVDDILDLFEKNKVKYFGIFGNHNLKYGNIQASKGTSFKHMINRGKDFNYLTTINDSKGKWIIQPYEYYYEMENDIKKNGIIFNKEFDDYFKIAVVHGHLCEKVFPFATHVQYKNINTNADLILVAHVHEPNEVKIGNTTFLNIGCMGRRKINEANIRPSCLLIDTNNRTWTKIELKSAKQANECFDLSKVEEEKESDQKLISFLEKLEDFNFQSIDFRDRIHEFAKQRNEENIVTNNIIERLNQLEMKNG